MKIRNRDRVATIMMILVLTKVLGFLKIRIIAQFFGVSRELDIFWAAFAIPDTLFNVLVAGMINAAIIPVFSSVLHKDGDNGLKNLFKRLNFLFVLFFVVISALAFALAPAIGDFLTRSEGLHSFFGSQSTVAPAEVTLFASLMRIMLLSPLLLGVSSLVTAYLQVRKRFFVTSLAPLLYNFGMILVSLVLVLWFDMGVDAIAWSVVAGSALHLLVQIPTFLTYYKASKDGVKNSLKRLFATIFNKEVIEVFKLALPRILGLLGEQVNVVVNTIISFTLSAGALSAYKFAFSLHLFPVQIFGGAISQIALPNLAEQFARGDIKEFEKTFNMALRRTLYLILPVVAVLLVLRLPLVRLAYGVGEFDWWATVITSWCLALLSLAILGQAVVTIVLRAFYAIHETRLPLVATVVAIIINIIGAYYFTNFFSHYFDWRPILDQIVLQVNSMNGGGLLEVLRSFGSDIVLWSTTRNVSDAAVGGLALATSVAFIAEMVVAMYLLSRRLPVITFKSTFKPLLPMLFNTFIMFVGMYFVYKLSDFNLDTTRTLAVITLTIVTTAFGCVSYAIGSVLLRLEEYDLVLGQVKQLKTAALSKLRSALRYAAAKIGK